MDVCTKPAIPVCTKATGRHFPPQSLVLKPVGAGRQTEVKQFIRERYAEAYDAHVTHFGTELLVAGAPRIEAAVAYTAADVGELFLEQYLDAPVEQCLRRAAHVPVARHQIVEVGNLAACAPGAARIVIAQLIRVLHAEGFVWVTFTATRELANSFRRLGLALHELAPADPARLRDGVSAWGRYYDHHPKVMTGLIAQGLVSGIR